MNTDKLLTRFRSDVPLPDDEEARRSYVLATGRRRGIGPARRPRLVLGVALAALVLVPTAVAVGLFEGTPAPQDVSNAFAEFNNLPDSAVQDGIAWKWPNVDASKAHGAIEVQTPDGPEDMWAAPTDQGGQCDFIDFANDPVGQHGMAGFGDCPVAGSAPASGIDFGDVWTYEHPDLKTVYGSVYVDAATVRLTFDDGATASIPVVEHLYLASTSKDVKVTAVTAFDSAGDQVAEWNPSAGG